MMNLIIINVLVFIAQQTVQPDADWVVSRFALFDVHSPFFRFYQVFTYMFLHGSMEHIFFNMFGLWMFGSVLENYLGAKKFIILFLVSGIGAGLLHLGVLYFENAGILQNIDALPFQAQLKAYQQLNTPTVGASGAIFGCLAAFGMLFPNSLVYIFFSIPMKAKYFVIVYAGLELLLAIQNSAGDTVAHFAHLGGALTAVILILIWNKRNRRTLY